MIGCPRCATIDSAVQAKLDRYAVDKRSTRWEGRAKPVLTFKSEVMSQGLAIQGGRCAWCTLKVGEEGRRTAHRDHIAPKAKYPTWTFLPKNLVITCEYCNGFLVKGETDTVANLHANYDDCDFHVVHPYLDDPCIHLSFRPHDGVPGVLIKSHSRKGEWTIKLFRLDTPEATANRTKDKLYERHQANLDPRSQMRFEQALEAIGK